MFNSSELIYNLINCVSTIDKLAKSKGCSNVFFTIDSEAIEENHQNRIVKTCKAVLGKEIASRTLCWDWKNTMNNYYFHKSKIKDKKEWWHEQGHFTKFAHEYFANTVKDKFNTMRITNEK